MTDNIGAREKKELADIIVNVIKEEFRLTHLTKNLMNTIEVKQLNNGDVVINIPAKMYDIDFWFKKHVVVYTGKGSYAQQVDDKGGFSKKHKDFLENAIKKAINIWLERYQLKGGVTYE